MLGLVPGRHADVPDVARGPVGAAMDPPVDDDAAADAGPDLDEQEVRDRAPVGPVFAEAHDVDVVVDEHRDAVPVGESLRHRVAVPAGHDRRVTRPARRMLNRAGTPIPIPRTSSSSRSISRSRTWKRSSAQSSTGSGPAAISMSPRSSASTVPPRFVTASREWVAPRSAARTTPASSLKSSIEGGRPPVDSLTVELTQQPLRLKLTQALGDGRPGEAGEGGEVRPVAPSAWRISRSIVPAPSGCGARRPGSEAIAPSESAPSAHVKRKSRLGEGDTELSQDHGTLLLDSPPKAAIGSRHGGGRTPGRRWRGSTRPASRPLRAGVIGAGFIGRVHARSARPPAPPRRRRGLLAERSAEVSRSSARSRLRQAGGADRLGRDRRGPHLRPQRPSPESHALPRSPPASTSSARSRSPSTPPAPPS